MGSSDQSLRRQWTCGCLASSDISHPSASTSAWARHYKGIKVGRIGLGRHAGPDQSTIPCTAQHRLPRSAVQHTRARRGGQAHLAQLQHRPLHHCRRRGEERRPGWEGHTHRGVDATSGLWPASRHSAGRRRWSATDGLGTQPAWRASQLVEFDLHK